MKNFFQQRKLLSLVAISAGLLALMVWLKQPNHEMPLRKVLDAPSVAPIRFGPGLLTESTPATAMLPVADDTTPPGGLETTADQHLIVNRALHDVLDYYLLGGHPGQRAAHGTQLQTYLKARLPAPAYGEAAQIVQAYLLYLEAHDALLARQSMPVPTPDSSASALDIDGIAAWFAQLSHLRQNVFGIKVAQIWYGEEEVESQQVLAAMRKRAIGAATPESEADKDPLQQTANTLRTLRLNGASQQAQRTQMAKQFGEPAARRFDALEREEQVWQARYASYRQAAEQISQQTGTAASDRAQLIASLREQTFASGAERFRAQALDARPRSTPK